MPRLEEKGPRKIYEIARDIRADWKTPFFGAKPYLEAMYAIGTINDCYGVEAAEEIILRFLCNAQTWRGDKAKAIKAELKAILAGVK